MAIETIDTHEAMRLFHEAMSPNSQKRFVRLTGDTNMGKTHLLTKVMPEVAEQQYQAHIALLDLSNPCYSVSDILDMACIDLGEDYFIDYRAVEQSFSNRPNIEIKGLKSAFSHVEISGTHNDDIRDRDRQLTVAFVKALHNFQDAPIVLFFDSVEQASEEIKLWLQNVLLLRLAKISHVRVVMAGRLLPDIHNSYLKLCQSYHLKAVEEIDEYFSYCQRVNPAIGKKLEEQSIQILALAFDFVPGSFAGAISKVLSQGLTHG